jgi:phosphopantothenoylcysteine decarboxylase/phosphopantothenate--cysteine ligase
MQLSGKKILLAVTGSIAAYKTPILVRLLVKAGADVKVLLTDAATDFVSPLALSTVSKHPVLSDIHDGSAWNNHVELGRWADVMLIAPCSAHSLAKLAMGLCDNLICAVYLSAVCPIFIAPAMDEDMWAHPATKANLARVRSFGHRIIPVGHGELASGLVGEGRMAEPEEITHLLEDYFGGKAEKLPLSGQKALVTAGPTFERLDPVRFIGNFSTGKMGIALAESLAALGAEVSLILGPSHLRPVHPKVKVIAVESADEMYQAATKFFPECKIAVMAAAVADYKPLRMQDEKIKKTDDALTLELTKTPDILKSLGAAKKDDQYVVGFALESHNELENARKKLQTKSADMIVLNSLRDDGAGFGHDTNKVTLLFADESTAELPLQSKTETAQAIIRSLLRYISATHVQ